LQHSDRSALEPYKRWLFAVDIHPSIGCVACGNCYGRGPANWLADEHNTADWKCVPFDYYGWRRYTPSAFWELATKYYHGLIDIDEEVKETLFSCAQCGLCDEICGIVAGEQRLSEIFRVFRFIIYEKTGPFRGHAEIINNIKTTGNIYGSKEPSSAWAEDLGLKILEKDGKSDTVLYVGDTAAYKLPNVARAAARVLKSAKIEFAIFEKEVNSGYYLEVMGDRAAAQEMWRKNLELFQRHGVKNVICLSAQDYHVLRREIGNSVNVYHITEYVAELIAKNKIAPKKRGGRVTYHDPCYLARHAGSRAPRGRRVILEPRKIINALGAELVEMPKKGRWTWCAGECGGVKEGFPDLAAWRAQKLIEEATATGAEILLTASPPEQAHILESMKDKENIKIADIMEILAENL